MLLADGAANALILDHDEHKALASAGTAVGSGLKYGTSGQDTGDTLAITDFGYRQFPYAGAGMHHKIYVRSVAGTDTVKFYGKVAGAELWTPLNGTDLVGISDVMTTSQLTDPPYSLIKIEKTGGGSSAVIDVQSWGAMK